MEDFDPEALKILSYRAKVALRKRARALRNTIPAEAIAERSARIRAALEGLPVVARARRIALFWPIVRRNEVDLRPLSEALRARGVEVAYPGIDPATGVMTFRIPPDPEAMEDRGLGFHEPSPEDPETTELDVIVVPALQVDPRGNRIGYGAGHYDRTLPRFCPPARSVGVVFDFQVISEVPVTEGDVAIDIVVSDERVIEVEREG
jgi:5-formyltetrahydrofolate cyclo-ligase